MKPIIAPTDKAERRKMINYFFIDFVFLIRICFDIKLIVIYLGSVLINSLFYMISNLIIKQF